MLEYTQEEIESGRQLTELEIVDKFYLEKRVLLHEDSILPNDGLSIFTSEVDVTINETELYQMQLFTDWIVDKCESLEGIMLYQDEVVEKLQLIISSCIGNAEQPEICYKTYCEICSFMPDLERDCGFENISNILKMYNFELIEANIELFCNAILSISLLCKYSQNTKVFEEVVDYFTQNYNQFGQYAEIPILQLFALFLKQNRNLDIGTFKRENNGCMAKLCMMVIRRPSGTLHTEYEFFIKELLPPELLAEFLYLCVSGDLEKGELARILILACERYEQRDALIFLSKHFDLPFRELAAYFSSDAEMQVYIAANQMRQQYCCFPESAIDYLSRLEMTSFLFMLDVFRAPFKLFDACQRSKIFEQFIREGSVFTAEEGGVIKLVYLSFYLGVELPRGIAELCGQVRKADGGVLYLLLHKGVLSTANYGEVVQSFQFTDEFADQFLALLETREPALFSLVADVMLGAVGRNKAEAQSLMRTPVVFELIIEQLSSQYSRIRRRMLQIVALLAEHSILDGFCELFTTKNLRAFQDVLVHIQIFCKSGQRDLRLYDMITAASIGMMFQRNGVLQQNYQELMKALYECSPERFSAIRRMTQLNLFEKTNSYENIDINDFIAEKELDEDSFSFYSDSIDGRIITHLSSQIRTCFCTDMQKLEGQRRKEKEFQDLYCNEFTSQLMKYGIVNTNSFECNNELSLDIEEIREQLTKFAFTSEAKALASPNAEDITSIISGSYDACLNHENVDLVLLQFALMELISENVVVTQEHADSCIKLSIFPELEVLLPELTYITIKFYSFAKKQLFARLINLNTTVLQINQIYYTTAEEQQGTNMSFADFYQMCTSDEYENIQVQCNFEVELTKENNVFSTLLANILVSRATRSSRTQSLIGVGEGHVGKVGNEKGRKRRIIEFISQEQYLEHEFYNGELITIFGRYLGTVDILTQINMLSVEELSKCVTDIDLRKLHSFLQTISNSDDDYIESISFAEMGKLMISIMRTLESHDDPNQESTVSDCKKFIGKYLTNTFSTVYKEHSNICEEIFDYCCLNCYQYEKFYESVKQIISEEKPLVAFNDNTYLPLIYNFLGSLEQICVLIEKIHMGTQIKEQLLEKIHKFSTQLKSESEIRNMLTIIEEYGLDEQILDFCLQQSDQPLSLEYLKEHDVMQFDEVLIKYISPVPFYEELFDGSTTNTHLMRTCSDIIKNNFVVDDIKNEIAANSKIFLRLFFEELLREETQDHLLSLLSSQQKEELLDFIKTNITTLKLGEMATTIANISRCSNDEELKAFESIKVISFKEISQFIVLLSKEEFLSSTFITLIEPFVLLCSNQIQNDKLWKVTSSYIIGTIEGYEVKDESLAIEQLFSMYKNISFIRELLISYYFSMSSSNDAFIDYSMAKIEPLLSANHPNDALSKILDSDDLDLQFFEIYIKLLGLKYNNTIGEHVFIILHQVSDSVLSNNQKKRELGSKCLIIVCKYFRSSAVSTILEYLFSEVRNSYEIFYLTNFAFAVLRTLEDDIDSNLFRLVSDIITANLFSTAEQVKHSELFGRIVREDKVYQLISLVISKARFSVSEANQVVSFITGLQLKSKDYRTNNSLIINAVAIGVEHNFSANFKVIIEFILLLLDDTSCKYCSAKPLQNKILIDRKQLILENEKLTDQERLVELENVHELLDIKPEALNLDSYIRATANINYYNYFCIDLSLSILNHYFPHIKNLSEQIDEEKNNLKVIFDYAIYTNNEKILTLLFKSLAYYLQVSQELSNKFIEQSISQLSFLSSNELKANIFDSLLVLLEKKQLSEQLQEKVLLAAIVFAKQLDNKIVQPFNIIIYFYLFYDDYHSLLSSTAKYFLNNGIFKLANVPNEQLIDLMAKVIELQYCQEKDDETIKTLQKLAVESELYESRIMALKCLESIAYDADTQISALFLLPARHSAVGVMADDLKYEIALLFNLICKEFSVFDKLFEPTSMFFESLCKLFSEALKIKEYRDTVFSHKELIKYVRNKVCKFEVSEMEAEDVEQMLVLCSASHSVVELSSEIVNNPLLFEQLVQYFNSLALISTEAIAMMSMDSLAHMIPRIEVQFENPVEVIDFLCEKSEILLLLLENSVTNNEEFVLEHGKLILKCLKRHGEQYLEQARAVIGIQEIYDYLIQE